MQTTPEIKSMRRGRRPQGPGQIRVDRQTPWGNPFRLAHESERQAVLDQHRRFLLEACLKQQPPYRHADLARLAQADSLWCWCGPDVGCHADNLKEAALAAKTRRPSNPAITRPAPPPSPTGSFPGTLRPTS